MTFIAIALNFFLSSAHFVAVNPLTIWDVSVEVPNIRCY